MSKIEDVTIWGIPAPKDGKIAAIEYGYYLHQMRKFCKLSGREMSKRLGVGSSTYLGYEKGKVLPRDLEGFHNKLKKVVLHRISETKKTSDSSL